MLYKKKFLNLINKIEKQYIKTNLPNIEIGDYILIKKNIQEGNKERIQISEGIIISKKNSQLNTTIIIRKIIHKIGVERIYLIHSPKIIDIQILCKSKTKRSKLYYLRNKIGKIIKLKQKFN
uniref:Ribosomal protein L19 n=1 Tax=Harveyella mirabilis TaxID=282355 RepID=A0A3S8UW57_9FLOR|nr:ribosomal protein L19 [Harveyella mirabilis]